MITLSDLFQRAKAADDAYQLEVNSIIQEMREIYQQTTNREPHESVQTYFTGNIIISFMRFASEVQGDGESNETLFCFGFNPTDRAEILAKFREKLKKAVDSQP